MRITRLASLTLLAALALSCRDAAPTSPAATTRSGASPRLIGAPLARDGAVAANITIPAPNGFVSTLLARGSFPDAIDVTFRLKEGATQVVHVDDPTQMVMARVTMAPGGALPWHTHPGPALVTISAGELTVVDGDDCSARRYAAGQSFMDTGNGHVHVAFNDGSVEMALYVTYLDVPVGQSPLVPTANPGC